METVSGGCLSELNCFSEAWYLYVSRAWHQASTVEMCIVDIKNEVCKVCYIVCTY